MTDDQKRKPAKDDSQGAPSLDADRHRAVIETSADGFLTVDGQGRIFEVNEAYVRRSGYSRSELLSMHVSQLEAKEDPAETAEHIRKLLREGSELFETLHRAKDGTIWQAEVNASFWPGDGGRFFNFVRDVTKRKRAEDALRESEEKFRTIFGQLQDGILIADAETLGFVETNVTMCAMLGYTREELLRLGMKDLHREADLPLARQAFARQLEGSLPLVTDIPMLRKDGSVFLADVNAAVIRLGERACLAGIFRDVTQRRRDERALAESEANYRALFEFSTDGIFLLDFEGNFVDANRTAYERLGYTREEFLGMSIRQLDDPAFAVRVPERMSQIRERGVAIFESGHRRKDGTTMPVEVNSRLLEYGGRTVLFSQIRDLTERKLAQEKEDRLLKAISVATEGIAITDRQDRFLYVNDAHARLYGRRPEELLGKTWRETVPPALVPAIEPELARALHRKTVGVWSGEAPGLRKDGSQFPMEVMATSRWDEAGDYLGHICIVRDITERKRTEELLRESEQKYRAIVETTSDWIWSCDTRGVHTYSNGAVQSILGREPAEIVGRSTEELLHPDDAAAAGAIIRQALASRSGWQGVQLRWRHGDGSYRTLESTATPTLDASGALLGWLGMDRDVTERKLLEEERLKTQKLESIGTLAGGIAHDFNNLLQGVFGYISMAKMPLDRGDRTYAMLDQAEKALHLSVNLTNQLLTFSKGGKPVKKRVALGPVIANAARFALSGSRSVCRLEIDPGLWEADADEGQIAQVIQNVALNADQAMPLGGTVTVTARNLPAAEAVAHPGLGPARARGDRRPGRGRGHSRAVPRQDLRPLLHDQGEGERARPRDLLLHREEPRGEDRGAVESRRRDHLHHLSARRRGGGCGGGGAGGPRGNPHRPDPRHGRRRDRQDNRRRTARLARARGGSGRAGGDGAREIPGSPGGWSTLRRRDPRPHDPRRHGRRGDHAQAPRDRRRCEGGRLERLLRRRRDLILPRARFPRVPEEALPLGGTERRAERPAGVRNREGARIHRDRKPSRSCRVVESRN